MKTIIGLGNPGKKYENTRHNVGWLALEHLRKKLEGSAWEDAPKFHSLISKGSRHREEHGDVAIQVSEHGLLRIARNDGDILLMKPTTFMNLSGDAVASLVHFYKLDPKNDIIVISDDLDMEFAKVRYRNQGSHGGQNGLRDIIAKLGTSEFSRVKIGIGRDDRYEVSDWVLSKFTGGEIERLEAEVFPKVEEYIINWLHHE